jgi:hypothetical protein
MEQPIMSNEFKRTEDKSFNPKTIAQLKKALKDTGIWSEKITGKKGDEITWDNAKVHKLFEDYKSGEREFYLSTYKNLTGETKTRLETGITTVRGQVYYQPTAEETLQLVQYVTNKVDSIDSRYTNYTYIGKNPQPVVKRGMVTSEILSRGLLKKRDNSMSGKVSLNKDSADPINTLNREMKEELGLDKEDFTVTNSSGEKFGEEMSFGFPGLWTKQKYTEYQIRLDKGFKEEYIDIGKPQPVKGGWKTQINVFRWEMKHLREHQAVKAQGKK